MVSLTDRAFEWAKSRSGVIEALTAWLDGQEGVYGDGRLTTDGRSILFRGVPMGVVICRTCGQARRVDVRMWSDIVSGNVTGISGVRDKLWLLFVLGVIESKVSSIPPERVSTIELIRERIANGEIEPCPLQDEKIVH